MFFVCANQIIIYANRKLQNDRSKELDGVTSDYAKVYNNVCQKCILNYPL